MRCVENVAKYRQLALKHRENHSQRQRIIVFSCSPVLEDEKALVKLAKKMKKLSISIDFIIFGEIDDDVTKKLTAFNEAVKGSEGSHLAIIPPGPGLLSDQLLMTPILNGDGSAVPDGMGGASTGGDGGSGGGGYDFGIDPAVDPELALALRMSMEEETARVQKAEKDKTDGDKKDPLDGIKEEDEAAPLLDSNGEPSQDKRDPKNDDDKMDTN